MKMQCFVGQNLSWKYCRLEIKLYTLPRHPELKTEVEKLPVRTAKKASGNGKLPVIKCCSCGAEIMMVANVKLMSEAIEAHIEKHKVRVKNSTANEAEKELIRDDLIKQVFAKATEQ